MLAVETERALPVDVIDQVLQPGDVPVTACPVVGAKCRLGNAKRLANHLKGIGGMDGGHSLILPLSTSASYPHPA